MPSFVLEVVREDRRILPVRVEAKDLDEAYDLLNKALSSARSDEIIHRHLDTCDSNSETEIQEPYDQDTYSPEYEMLTLAEVLAASRKEY